MGAATVFDRILTSVPVNKASAVGAGGGLGYVPRKPIAQSHVHSDLPLPTRLITGALREQPGFVDLTGWQVGKFRVVGLSASVNSRWVVRCVCGAYEVRRAKVLREPHPGGCHHCSHCEHTLVLRKRASLSFRT